MLARSKKNMTLPNFFIVGAPKAGTDELYYELDQHPQIYMSPLKEPCYFSSEVRPQYFNLSLRSRAEAAAESTRQYIQEGMQQKRFGGFVSDLKDYQQLFSRVKSEKAIGEGSVCYLWSESAPAAIASEIPRARIIIVLMDPAERAFHQYLKSVSDGTVSHSFRKHLELAMQPGPELSVYHPFLAFGNYAKQISNYRTYFPAHQLNISLYEETLADHAVWFSRLLSFLEVESSFLPRRVEIPSEPRVPHFVGVTNALRNHPLKKVADSVIPKRFKKIAKRLMSRTHLPGLDPRDRAALVEYYKTDILKLQDLLGKDLSTWLK